MLPSTDPWHEIAHARINPPGLDKRDLNWTELGFRASRCFGELIAKLSAPGTLLTLIRQAPCRPPHAHPCAEHQHSRVTAAAGICDDDLGACYCDGPMGRIPAPTDAPPGTPPVRRGRPLTHAHDQPKTVSPGHRAKSVQTR